MTLGFHWNTAPWPLINAWNSMKEYTLRRWCGLRWCGPGHRRTSYWRWRVCMLWYRGPCTDSWCSQIWVGANHILGKGFIGLGWPPQSMGLPICLSVHPSVSWSVCWLVSQPVSGLVSQSVSMSICLSVCLSVCLSSCLSVCPSVCLSIWLASERYCNRSPHQAMCFLSSSGSNTIPAQPPWRSLTNIASPIMMWGYCQGQCIMHLGISFDGWGGAHVGGGGFPWASQNQWGLPSSAFGTALCIYLYIYTY